MNVGEGKKNRALIVSPIVGRAIGKNGRNVDRNG